MKIKKRITSFAMIFFFIFMSLALAQTRRVKITVKDTGGKPIKGVKITMTSPETETFKMKVVTNEKGETKFLVQMEINVLQFLLEKEGYQSLQESFPVKLIRSTQRSLEYEHTFILYRSNELTPQQKREKGEAGQRALILFEEGMTFFQDKNYQEAEIKFKEAIQLRPDFVEAHQNLAATYYRQEKYSEAIEIAKKALDIEPNLAPIIKLISVAYSALGDEKKALEYQDRLKELPDAKFSPEEYFNMGATAANEGRDEEAAEYFKKATEIRPDYALAYYHLGLAYFRTQKMDLSRAALQRYLELEPGGENAENARKLIEVIDNM